MFLKIIMVLLVSLTSIVKATKNDDVLVIDPRDIRLFESVWKLGFHSGRDSQKQLEQGYHSRSLPSSDYQMDDLPRLHINSDLESESHFPMHFRQASRADNKFMKKMFTPEGIQKYFGDKGFVSIGNDVDGKQEEKKKTKKFKKSNKYYKRGSSQWHNL